MCEEKSKKRESRVEGGFQSKDNTNNQLNDVTLWCSFIFIVLYGSYSF